MVGVENFWIVVIFFGIGRSFFFFVICFKYFKFWNLIKYLFGFVVKFVVCSFFKNFFIICRCFWNDLVYIIILFIKLLMNCIFFNSFFIKWLKLVDVLIRLNGIILNWNSLSGVWKVVMYFDVFLRGNC